MLIGCSEERVLSRRQWHFGEKGRTASEEVVLELIRTKCISILLYGLKVLPLYQYQLRSLDFVIIRLFMKLFRTSDIQVVAQCQGKSFALICRVFSLLVVGRNFWTSYITVTVCNSLL